MGQVFNAAFKSANQEKWHMHSPYDFNSPARMCQIGMIGNPLVLYVQMMIFRNPMQVVFAGCYGPNEEGSQDNIFHGANSLQVNLNVNTAMMNELSKLLMDMSDKPHYLVNHTKKEYVDYSKVERNAMYEKADPLPILCAEGNGEGCGDYEGNNKELAGIWARDLISLETEKPTDFAELTPRFMW